MRYFLRRLVQSIPTLIGVAVVSFLVVRLMGDPEKIMLEADAPPAARAEFRARHGLDRPLVIQFFYFLINIVRGEFGESMRYRVPVANMISERIPATLVLGCTAVILAIVIAWPLGLLAGLRRGGKIDAATRAVSLVGQAIPGFYLGIVLIFVFAVALRVLPTGGNRSYWHLILPATTLAMALIPLLLRVTRSSVIGVMSSDYLRTAEAKGLSRRRIVARHVIRNSLVPVITVIGLQLGSVIGGAVVAESVFAWPGVGRLLVDAVGTRDYPVIRAVIVLASATFLGINLIVDLLQAKVDPRISLK